MGWNIGTDRETQVEVTTESDDLVEYCMKIGRRMETGHTPVDERSQKQNETCAIRGDR